MVHVAFVLSIFLSTILFNLFISWLWLKRLTHGEWWCLASLVNNCIHKAQPVWCISKSYKSKGKKQNKNTKWLWFMTGRLMSPSDIDVLRTLWSYRVLEPSNILTRVGSFHVLGWLLGHFNQHLDMLGPFPYVWPTIFSSCNTRRPLLAAMWQHFSIGSAAQVAYFFEVVGLKWVATKILTKNRDYHWHIK